MILPFNADRLLARVAAAGRRREERRPHPRSRLGPLVKPVAPAGPKRPAMFEGGNVPLGPQHDRLERLVTTGVVGEPEQLRQVLTSDARGWSPAFSYSSRDEAITQLRDHSSPLLVLEFTPDAMWWTPPCLWAEWRLVAVHAEPFLVADDVLIDVCDDPVHLAGASVITLRDERATAVHTYYDEGSLVEQVILRRHPDGAGAERAPPFPD